MSNIRFKGGSIRNVKGTAFKLSGDHKLSVDGTTIEHVGNLVDAEGTARSENRGALKKLLGWVAGILAMVLAAGAAHYLHWA